MIATSKEAFWGMLESLELEGTSVGF